MRSQRLALASGAIYVLAILIGNGLAEGGESSGDDAAVVLAELQRGLSPVQVFGLTLEILGFALFVVFLGALYRALRRAGGSDGDSWLAVAALGGGLISIAVKVASIGPGMTARMRADDLSPELARTLEDLGGASFVISGYTLGIFLAAAALATLVTRIVPRWLASAGVVVGVLTLAAGTAGILDPAGYVPIPFLLGLLWILVVSVVLAVRPPSTGAADRTGRAAGTVPAGAVGTA
jgi:predicted nucleic acid-binding protein